MLYLLGVISYKSSHFDLEDLKIVMFRDFILLFKVLQNASTQF